MRRGAPSYAAEAEGDCTFTVREARGQLLAGARTCCKEGRNGQSISAHKGPNVHSNFASCRVEEVYLGNSATPDTMVGCFMRQSVGIVPIWVGENLHLATSATERMKHPSVLDPTPIRGAGAGPPGPERVRGVSNTRTEEDDLWLGQPVHGTRQVIIGVKPLAQYIH